MKKYDEIKFKGLDWYIIDINKDTTKLLLKNILEEEIVKQCIDDEWYRNENYVRMSNDVKPPFIWENSYIYKTVLPKFKEYLNIDCEVDLLSKEEVENLLDVIRKSNGWYWTKTPSDGEDWAYAFRMHCSGNVAYDNVHYVSGVRPSVKIFTNLLYKENGDKNLLST